MRWPTRLLTAGWAFLAMSGGPVATHAEEAEAGARGRPVRPFFVQVSVTPAWQVPSDFKDADGSFEVFNYDISGTVILPIPRRGRLNLTASHDRFHYRFEGNDVIRGLLNPAYASGVSAVYMGRLSPKWSIFSLANLQHIAEKGVSLSDGRTLSGQVQFQRQLTDDLQIGVGLFVASRLDEDVQAFPLASIFWKITDRWSLRTTRGLRLAYQLDERGHWEAGIASEYFTRRIRLDDGELAPGGVFRTRALVSTLSLVYKPNPGIRVGAEIGFAPYRAISIRDAEKQTVFRARTEEGFSTAFRASLTF
jgi:hypothetical protein